MLFPAQFPFPRLTFFVTLPPKIESSNNHAATVATPDRNPVFNPIALVTEPPILLLEIHELTVDQLDVVLIPIPFVTSVLPIRLLTHELTVVHPLFSSDTDSSLFLLPNRPCTH